MIQIEKPLEQLSQRHLRFAEIFSLGNLTKGDAMRSAGFSDSMAKRGDLIGNTREQSKYPSLWDYFQKLRRKRLRLFDVSAESLENELRIIAFSKITDFVSIPTRRDLQRQQLFDAKIRKSMGYRDDEDDALIALENDLRKDLTEGKNEKLQRFAPGANVKLRCLEDIPEELIPAIRSIKETRDGIELRLYDKLEAIDKLARMRRFYDDPDSGDKPTVIENLNVIVNGSKSNLLDDLDKI